MSHFTRLLSTLFVIALLGGASLAQAQETENRQYVIIQKTEHADGSQTVVKQRVAEGKSLTTVLQRLRDADGKEIDIQIINDEGEHIELEEATKEETLVLYRRAKEQTEKIEKEHEEVERVRIVIRNGAEGEYEAFQWHQSGHERPYVGIYVDEDVEAGGVAISRTIPGGGAETAGLQAADVITAVNGQPIRDRHDLREAIGDLEPGAAVAVTYLREGGTGSTELTLTGRDAWAHRSRERDPCKVFIGVYVGGQGAEGYGVNVNGIIDETPAEDVGMQSGDLILSLDGVPVSSNGELLRERNKHEPGDWFTLTYLREGVPTDIRAQFRSCEEEAPAEEITPEAPVTEAMTEAPAVPELQIDNTLPLERLQIFPNPTYGELRVEFEGPALPTTVRLLDASGRTIFEDVRNRFDGYYNEQLDLTGENSGQYFLQIIQGEQMLTEKVVKIVRA